MGGGVPWIRVDKNVFFDCTIPVDLVSTAANPIENRACEMIYSVQ